jgi:hypothetical protein
LERTPVNYLLFERPGGRYRASTFRWRLPVQVQVVFDSAHREATKLGEFAARRARFALRRVIGLNPRARLELSGASGPHGAAATRCHVRLETDGGGTAVATAMAGDWRVAIEEALTRAVRRLLRLWRRAVPLRRLPPPRREER